MPLTQSSRQPEFRFYRSADRETCLRLFDLNSPTAFAPNERADYERFLDEADGKYEICIVADDVVGAYGLYREGDHRLALRWILLSPASQGRGLGAAMMARIKEQLHACDGATLRISASHKSAPFFAKFGARERDRIPNGWGPGMHRVEMELAP